MSHYIPFVYNVSDCTILKDIYADTKIARVPVDRVGTLAEQLPEAVDLWVDPLVDGLYPTSGGRDQKWEKLIASYANSQKLSDAGFVEKAKTDGVMPFVNDALNTCANAGAKYVTIPQLPCAKDARFNRLNRELAKATRIWAEDNDFSVELILPVIFTNQKQVNKKTDRNPRVKNAAKCFELSGASGYWIVDQSLPDQAGSTTLRNRHSGIIDFHSEFNAKTSSPRIRIAGPYWGLNLVLWARGLINYPAIGVGRGYQYFLSGGLQMQSKVRVAIPSLRRLVSAQQSLADWLDGAREKISRSTDAYYEFRSLSSQMKNLTVREVAKKQVAKAYKEWIDVVEAASPSGRALALYQDLSSAYVLGKSLHLKLPESEAPARRPEQVAENLMLRCL